MTWSVTIGDRPTPILVEVLQCQSIFRRLTPLQRTAVLNPKDSAITRCDGHPAEDGQQ